jgi:hypothetical protein
MAQNYNIGALGRVLTVNSTANTATYTSALVVGNSSVNVVVNSSSVYLSGSPLTGTNTAAQYTWSNTQTFSNTITFTSTIVGTANNANNLGGVAAASYVNTSGSYTISGIQTYNANLVIGSTGELVFNTAAGIYANGSLGTAGQVLTSNGTTVYWATAAGGGSVNLASSYAWTNTHTWASYHTIDSSGGQFRTGGGNYGVRIFGGGGSDTTAGILQFTNNPVSAQWGSISVNSISFGLGSDTTANVSIRTNGTTRCTIDTSGNLGVTGDVISNFSDMRLKNVSGPVLSALDKVSKINTFYYTPNKMALSIGADNEMKTRIGVSAQQMQEILPEVVFDSPLGQGYITVQYERIVPLLIEAIKELKAEVDRLNKEKQE